MSLISHSLASAVEVYRKIDGKAGVERLFAILDDGNLAVMKQREYVREQMSLLSAEAEARRRECAESKAEAENRHQTLINQKVWFEKSEKNERDNISALETEFTNCQQDLNEALLRKSEIAGDVSSIQREITAVKEDNKTKKILAGVLWFTIAGGYFIGRAIESTTELEGRIGALQSEINDINAQVEKLSNRIGELQAQMRNNRQSSSQSARKLSYTQQEVNRVITQMNIASEAMALWELLRGLYDRVIVSVDNALSVKSIVECFESIVNLDREYKNAADLSETSFGLEEPVRTLVYRGNALYSGQILKRSEYLASLNRKFIAVMQDDGSFVVYNSERPIWASGTWGNSQAAVEFKNGACVIEGGPDWRTKGDSAVILVMQDDGNLVTYDWNWQSLWATDTWNFGALDTQPFFVPYTPYNGTFRIESFNGRSADISGASADDEAELILWRTSDVSNQKFSLKQLPDGSHMIAAVHSGKALDVFGEVQYDGGKVMQYPYHGGGNQQWFVVPACRDGYVRLVCKHSGRCLDVSGANFSDGTKLQQYHDNGSQAQMFKLIPIN